MSKTMKLITSVMFVVLCILFTIAVIQDGEKQRIKELERLDYESRLHLIPDLDEGN